jgi:hypothetical protein
MDGQPHLKKISAQNSDVIAGERSPVCPGQRTVQGKRSILRKVSFTRLTGDCFWLVPSHACLRTVQAKTFSAGFSRQKPECEYPNPDKPEKK